MPLHRYIKERQKTRIQILVHNLSYLSLTGGAILLFWAYYPIISFSIYSHLFFEKTIATPIPRNEFVSSIQAAQSVLGTADVYSSNLRDFVQANVWFPTRPQNLIANNITVKEYTLSIPKLNIRNAKVTVGGEDLSKSLVHYLPTSLPGSFGSVAIFGHSSLPQLYNVKDYKTIFTYLPSMEKGDKVYVKLDGQEYEYQVFDIFIVNPDDVSVLEQRFDASYLIIVTCVPPGSVDKRLIVRAKLNKIPN
jgi:sortase A